MVGPFVFHPSLVPFAAKAMTETSIRGPIGSREPPAGEMADDDTPEKTLPSAGMNGQVKGPVSPVG
jgi:hypothetical protein